MNSKKLKTTEEEEDIRAPVWPNLKLLPQCSKAAGCATSVLNQL